MPFELQRGHVRRKAQTEEKKPKLRGLKPNRPSNKIVALMDPLQATALTYEITKRRRNQRTGFVKQGFLEEIHDVNNEVAELTQGLGAFNSSVKVSRKKNPREIYSPGLIRIMQSRNGDGRLGGITFPTFDRGTRYVPRKIFVRRVAPLIRITPLARFLISINPSSVVSYQNDLIAFNQPEVAARLRETETEESRTDESDAFNRRARGSANVNRPRSSRDDVSDGTRCSARGEKRKMPHRSPDERVTDREKGNQ